MTTSNNNDSVSLRTFLVMLGIAVLLTVWIVTGRSCRRSPTVYTNSRDTLLLNILLQNNTRLSSQLQQLEQRLATLDTTIAVLRSRSNKLQYTLNKLDSTYKTGTYAKGVNNDSLAKLIRLKLLQSTDSVY